MEQRRSIVGHPDKGGDGCQFVAGHLGVGGRCIMNGTPGQGEERLRQAVRGRMARSLWGTVQGSWFSCVGVSSWRQSSLSWSVAKSRLLKRMEGSDGRARAPGDAAPEVGVRKKRSCGTRLLLPVSSGGSKMRTIEPLEREHTMSSPRTTPIVGVKNDH